MKGRLKQTPIIFWMVVAVVVPESGCIKAFQTNRSDILWQAKDATLSVLRESWLEGSTIIHVTDGAKDTAGFQRVIEKAKLDFSASVFRLPPLGSDPSQRAFTFNAIDKVQKTSKFVTMMVASDDIRFLSNVIEDFVNRDLLVWPTRLLVVSRLNPIRLRHLEEFLSVTNSMVITLEVSSNTVRMYAYLPFNHRVIHIASWAHLSGLTYKATQKLFPDKYRRLPGAVEMKVVGQNFPPHAVVHQLPSSGDSTNAEEIAFTGPLISVLEMLANNLNFTYKLMRPPDGSWGIFSPNGTWNGMVGMLHRKEVDFGLGFFAMNYYRAQVVDYTNYLFADDANILGRRGDTAVDPWSFALPLKYPVWGGILASLLFILSLSVATSFITKNAKALSNSLSLGTYIRTLVLQDIKKSSRGTWEKVMLGTWMLSCFILIKSYSTNLISLLAVRYVPEPHHTIREMLDDPGVTMMWVANTAHQQFLAGVESGIFRELVEVGKRGRIKLITPKGYVPTINEFVSRGDHVMINPATTMKMFLSEDYMDEKGNCKFYFSREGFLPLTFCMVVQKYSPLRGPINQVIRAVIEGGFYNYWIDNAFANAKSCKNPPTKITVKAPLSLANIWGMFVLLIGGYIISFLVFCIEIPAASREWTY